MLNEILKSPHTLIAGCTGSGKSVMLNSLITRAIEGYNILYLIDLKRVELKRYANVENVFELATEPEEVLPILDQVIDKMESRYKVMEGVKSPDLDVYLVIDELADLISQKGVLERIIKIGRLGRAANIHMICATQDPSRKTLPAALVQNFTTRIALRCQSPIESRQIIGVKGAEALPQYGKAYMRDPSGVTIIDVPFTPDDVIEDVVLEHEKEPSFHLPKVNLKPLLILVSGVGRLLIKGLTLLLRLIWAGTLFIIKIPFKAMGLL